MARAHGDRGKEKEGHAGNARKVSRSVSLSRHATPIVRQIEALCQRRERAHHHPRLPEGVFARDRSVFNKLVSVSLKMERLPTTQQTRLLQSSRSRESSANVTSADLQ